MHLSEAKVKTQLRKGLAITKNLQSNALVTTGSNFSISAGPIAPTQQFMTTYKSAHTDAHKGSDPTRRGQVVPAQLCSINLGQGHSSQHNSVQRFTYTGVSLARDLAEEKSTAARKEQIKKNNFEYGSRFHSAGDHYRTTTQKTYGHHGDACKIKAVLDPSKKKDLRANHFDVGGQTANTAYSTACRSYRPHSAMVRQAARPKLDESQKANLRASHWGTQQRSHLPRPSSAATFVTTNMVNFQWVAPRPMP